MAGKLLTTEHLALFDSAYTRRYAPHIDGPIRIWKGTSTNNETLLFEGADVSIGRGNGVHLQWLWFKNGIASSGIVRGFTVDVSGETNQWTNILFDSRSSFPCQTNRNVASEEWVNSQRAIVSATQVNAILSGGGLLNRLIALFIKRRAK